METGHIFRTSVAYLVYDIGTEDGFFHVSLIRFNDWPYAVHYVTHFWREITIWMFQKFCH